MAKSSTWLISVVLLFSTPQAFAAFNAKACLLYAGGKVADAWTSWFTQPRGRAIQWNG